MNSKEDDKILSESSTDEEREYEVEEILAEQDGEDGSTYYLIKWKDYDDERSDTALVSFAFRGPCSCPLTFSSRFQDVPGSLPRPSAILKPSPTGVRVAAMV